MSKHKRTYEELEKKVLEFEEEAKRRKLAEKAILKSEDNFRVLFEKAPLGYQSLDDRGCLITVNQAWLDLLGYERKEIIGKSFGDFLSPQYQQKFKKIFPRFKKTGEIKGIEFELVKKDGSFIFASIEGKVGHDKQGKFKQTHCVLQDITERKLAAEALRESEEQLDSVLKNIPDIIYRLDRAGNISFINDAIKDYGYTPEELIGKSIFEIVHPEDREKAIYRVNERRTGERKTKSFEIRLFLREGAADLNDELQKLVREPVFLLDSEGLYQTGEDQAASLSGTQGIARDITERKQMGQAISTIMESAVKCTGQEFFDRLVKSICEWSGTDYTIVGELVENNKINVLSMYLDGEFKYGFSYNLEGSPCENASTKGYCAILSDVRKKFPHDQDLVRMGAESYAGMPLKDDNGKTIGILCTMSREKLEIPPRMKDVMTILAASASAEIMRSRSGKAMRESEARLKAIYDNVAIGIAVADNKGRFIQVNKHYVEMFGYDSEEELIEQTVFQLTHPEDRESTRHAQEDLASGQIGYIRTDKRYLRKDGNCFWGDVTVTPFKLKEGERQVFVAMIADITERKRMEEKYKNLFQASRDAIMTLEPPQWNFTSGNPASIRMFNVENEEDFCSRSLWQYSPEMQPDGQPSQLKAKKMIETAMEEGSNFFDWTHRGLSSEDFPATILLSRIETYGRKYLQATIRDITERKQLEEEQVKAAKLESIGILAGGIAHDFNNILTAILGNISLAKIFADEDINKVKQILADAEKATLSARDLTQQLLTFSKGGEPVKKTIRISSLLVDAVRFALRGSNVKVDFQLEEALWAVDADEGQIVQVINNIVINACQAMPKGGVIRIQTANVTVGSGESPQLAGGKYVKISVRDQGTGIAEEYLSQIFDPYFTTKQKGSGLGLATSYSIVERHHGSIAVESEREIGTTFQIYLPASAKLVEEQKEKKTDDLVAGGKVLVMDDEPGLRNVVSKMLEHIGHEVEVAADGEEAVRLYKKAMKSNRPFDVVILDLTIPGGLGGKATIGKLLEIDPEVKAIVSSGYSNDPVMSNFREYMFSAMVSKPYQLDELKKVLRSVMQDKNG